MRKVHFIMLVLLGGTTGATAQELPPPDVTFYAAVESSRTDFRRIGIDEDTSGVRLRGGLWLNELRLGRWIVGIEGAYNQLGDATSTSSFQREPTGQELNRRGNLDFVTVTTDRSRTAGGLELGARLYDSELFYLRGGAYLYSYRARADQEKEFTLNDGSTLTNDPLPEAESTSTLGPYAGAGFAFPIAPRLRLTTDVSVYYIESEPLNSISIGLQVRDER